MRTKVVGEDVIQLQEVPEDGFYAFIADIRSASVRTTKIDAYFYDGADNELLKTVKKWAHGEDKTCPDLTKYAR